MEIQQGTNPDPLLYHFDMPLEETYYPVGFPIKLTTNSSEVLAAAAESWRHFRQTFSDFPLHVRIGVLNGGPVECPGEPVFRAHRSLLTRVADAENFSVSDIEHGYAFAWLTQATVQDRAYLRWNFIEGIGWDLLAKHLTPIHAGCVRLHGCGVLLCGDSGAGKSSLAFACALAGWTYISDDASRLVHREQELTVVGNPYQIRFRETAKTLFPHLKNQQLTLRATGELAIELPTASVPGIRLTTKSAVDFIVFLNRNSNSQPELLPFSRDEALRWFEQVVCWGEAESIQAHKNALKRLLSAEVFEFRYSDLDSAVKKLETLVAERRVATFGAAAFRKSS